MKISIVIPTMNEEKYLANTLQSIKKLNIQPDEVICVDYKSTDATKEICKKYKAIFVAVNSKGVSLARQRGLERASGDIVVFTDADTLVPQSWLEDILIALNSPEVVGVYGSFRVKDGPYIYRLFMNHAAPLIVKIGHFIKIDFPGGQNIACKRVAALKAGGFPLDFQSVEDFEIIRRLKKVGKIKYLEKNILITSGRRGNEGFALVLRVMLGIFKYYTTGKADSFTFPAIR